MVAVIHSATVNPLKSHRQKTKIRVLSLSNPLLQHALSLVESTENCAWHQFATPLRQCRLTSLFLPTSLMVRLVRQASGFKGGNRLRIDTTCSLPGHGFWVVAHFSAVRAIAYEKMRSLKDASESIDSFIDVEVPNQLAALCLQIICKLASKHPELLIINPSLIELNSKREFFRTVIIAKDSPNREILLSSCTLFENVPSVLTSAQLHHALKQSRHSNRLDLTHGISHLAFRDGEMACELGMALQRFYGFAGYGTLHIMPALIQIEDLLKKHNAKSFNQHSAIPNE